MLRAFRCLLWVAAILSASAHAAEVQGVRLWAEADGSTRIVLDLAAPVGSHSIFSLENPSRVVVDLENSRLLNGASLPGAAGSVLGVRSGPQGNSGLRVVLDLRDGQSVQARSFSLPPSGGYGHRLVIDLVPAGQGAPQANGVAAADPVGRDLVIVVDAGHGGRDPGAVGRNQLEKDVVLAISLELARQINAEPGMRAILTRDGDYFVDLRERMEAARGADADLFISIHADAYSSAAASGATVYVLSQGAASNEAAAILAERENQAFLLGGASLSEYEDTIATVLMELTQHATMAASYSISEHVIAQMANVTRVRRMDILRGPFMVLRSPDVPSLLIETGYMTNPDDERALADTAHQRRLAESILAGIRGYFYENPKPGTFIANRLREGSGLGQPLQHVVASGDTLSGIALRYNVSLQALRSSNALNGDVIHIGQRLTIPGFSSNGTTVSAR